MKEFYNYIGLRLTFAQSLRKNRSASFVQELFCGIKPQKGFLEAQGQCSKHDELQLI